MVDHITFFDLKDNLIADTYSDYNLKIQDFSITSPEIKEEIEEIPGSDELLDYTESLSGDVHYSRRVIHTVLAASKIKNEFLSVYSRIYNTLHGRKVKLIHSKEPNFYWVGRIKAADINPYLPIRNIILDVDVEPYKYDIQNANEDWLWDPFSFEDGIINECKNIEIDGELEVVIYGRRKHVIPIFSVQGQISVIYNDTEYELIEGNNNEVVDIEIIEGKNKLKFNGNGTVNIDYRGGSL